MKVKVMNTRQTASNLRRVGIHPVCEEEIKWNGSAPPECDDHRKEHGIPLFGIHLFLMIYLARSQFAFLSKSGGMRCKALVAPHCHPTASDRQRSSAPARRRAKTQIVTAQGIDSPATLTQL